MCKEHLLVPYHQRDRATSPCVMGYDRRADHAMCPGVREYLVHGKVKLICPRIDLSAVVTDATGDLKVLLTNDTLNFSALGKSHNDDSIIVVL